MVKILYHFQFPRSSSPSRVVASPASRVVVRRATRALEPTDRRLRCDAMRCDAMRCETGVHDAKRTRGGERVHETNEKTCAFVSTLVRARGAANARRTLASAPTGRFFRVCFAAQRQKAFFFPVTLFIFR